MNSIFIWTSVLKSIVGTLIFQNSVLIINVSAKDRSFTVLFFGVPVAQWVKPWPTDLVDRV